MKSIELIKNTLLYGGLDKESYNKYREELTNADNKNIHHYLLITSFGFTILGLVSYTSTGFAHVNTLIYALTGFASIVLLIAWYILKWFNIKSVLANVALIYLFIGVLYFESIAVTMQHEEMPAVTFIGILLMIPLLFSQRPIYTIIFQGCFTVAFCYIVKVYKLPEVATIDIWNVISFFALSTVAILLMIPMRIRSFAQSKEILFLSEHDILTGLRNRNSFEKDCSKYEKEQIYPIVVYADANGLHELNNSGGHEQGDKMLQNVANQLIKYFGVHNAYRIGGDEFVAFCFGCDKRAVENEIDLMQSALEDAGYSVAFGCHQKDSKDTTLNSIVKKAEVNMYISKNQHYASPDNDRRHR